MQMRALQILLMLVALGACVVLGLLAASVWWADPAAVEHLRRDVAYGWLLIQAAPLIGVTCILVLCCAITGLLLIARQHRLLSSSAGDG